MDDLVQTIKGLNSFQTSEAVKNLRLSLQYHWQHKLNDEEVKEALQSVAAEGATESLRNEILSGAQDAEAMERWGKSLLIFMAADEEAKEYVQQAVADALNASTKDFGISALLVIGAVVVLLKWRPKKIAKDKDGWSVEWEDNDVSVVSDLAKIAGN